MSSQHSTPRAWRVHWLDCQRNGSDDYLAFFQATGRPGSAPREGDKVIAAEDYDSLVEQHAALIRIAESVRDSWVLWQNDVDIAHLDHACSELDNWLVRQAAREAVGG